MNKADISFQTDDGINGHLRIHVGMDNSSLVIVADVRDKAAAPAKVRLRISRNLSKKIMAFIVAEFNVSSTAESGCLDIDELVFPAMNGNYHIRFSMEEIPMLYGCLRKKVMEHDKEYTRHRHTVVKNSFSFAEGY